MSNIEMNTQELELVKKFSEKVALVKEELKKDVVGQKEIIDNVIVARNSSPGAAKRGASGCITRFGVTLACTEPAPVARLL